MELNYECNVVPELKNAKEIKLNDIMYFSHGFQVVKCKIEEIIKHYTQKELIEKFIVRFYGTKDFTTITSENLFTTYTEAKKVVKEKLDASYKNAYKTLDEVTEEYCDEKENKYQEELKREKNGIIKF